MRAWSLTALSVALVSAGLVAAAPLAAPAGARPPVGHEQWTSSLVGRSAPAQRPAPKVKGPKVVVIGDVACPPGRRTTRTTCKQRATSNLALKLAPRAVIAVGDLQYEKGELANFQGSYDPSWGRLKGRTYPVPGNHEYRTPGASGYYQYFGISSPGYSVATIGTWRVYLLNSLCGQIDCAAQRQWLETDMAAHPVRCSAIAMHFPRYSSGEHGNNASMARFWRIAMKHGADVALAGHDHDYERFAKLNANGKYSKKGLRSFVAGTGGKSLYSKQSSPKGSRYFRADKFGVLAMTFGRGAYDWRFRTIGGAVRDKGSARCR